MLGERAMLVELGQCKDEADTVYRKCQRRRLPHRKEYLNEEGEAGWVVLISKGGERSYRMNMSWGMGNENGINRTIFIIIRRLA